MKLVVDSNVLFPFFWEKSVTRKLFLSQNLELVSPEFVLEEIIKYSEEITKKAKINKNEFDLIKRELAVVIEFIPMKEYSGCLKKALHVSPDEEDVDFFALALKFNISIWSNDNDLKKQKEVKVYSTKEIINVL